MSEQTKIDALRKRRDDAHARLCKAIATFCPGNHQPRQHRDGLPPWCPECGRTVDGVSRAILHDRMLSDHRRGSDAVAAAHDVTGRFVHHGFTPSVNLFGGDPDRCGVTLSRGPCPFRRDEHDPALPPVDTDAFGRRRKQRGMFNGEDR